MARRVLHVTRMSGVGGSENHLRVLLPELAARGWEPDLPHPVAALVRDPRAGRGFLGRCRRAWIVPMRRDGSPALLVRIARLLRSGGYQLVHSHLGYADWDTAVASAGARGVALISTKHNDDPFRRMYPFRVVERAVSHRCAATIMISDALRDFTLRYPPPRTEITTVLRAQGSAPGAGARF